MDVIEFLKRTDHRNLKQQIDFLVKHKFSELDSKLEERRERLRQLLASEAFQYERELNDLQRANDEEKEAKRQEWIGLMRLNRERDETQLLEMKKNQREFENSEEYKHMRSREILLESKQAQLHQIEEKKLLNARQVHNERFWLNAMQAFGDEQKRQAVKEQQLRKCIADRRQQENLELDDETRMKNKMENDQLRQETNEVIGRTWTTDQKHRREEEFYEWRKKVHHKNILERQMYQNALQNSVQKQREEINTKVERRNIQNTILAELDKKGAAAVQNRTLHKEYLEQSLNEKKAAHALKKEVDELLIGTGCVLEQTEKRPYGKNSR